jgi:hypothetical protein
MPVEHVAAILVAFNSFLMVVQLCVIIWTNVSIRNDIRRNWEATGINKAYYDAGRPPRS